MMGSAKAQLRILKYGAIELCCSEPGASLGFSPFVDIKRTMRFFAVLGWRNPFTSTEVMADKSTTRHWEAFMIFNYLCWLDDDVLASFWHHLQTFWHQLKSLYARCQKVVPSFTEMFVFLKHPLAFSCTDVTGGEQSPRLVTPYKVISGTHQGLWPSKIATWPTIGPFQGQPITLRASRDFISRTCQR